MKKILFITIASLALITLCFTNCKKKDTPSFPMNGTTWTYPIPNIDPATATQAPSLGTVTLIFTTDKVSGTVKLANVEKPTDIPATAYTYDNATSKGNINGLDLLGVKLPKVDFTVSADKKTFTSIALNTALGKLGIKNVVFTKK